MKEKFISLVSNPSKKMSGPEIDYLAACFREIMFTTLHGSGTGHWGGASSAAELITALYFNRLNINPSNPKDENRDRFILSKGHASVNLYTILSYRGYIPPELIPTFRKMGSILQGHPAMLRTPGVDMSSGALGHGLSVGIGMALAAALNKKNYRTYVMVGEGCLNEGSTWEAIMYASKMKVRNLILLVDHNRVQLDGTEDEIMPLGSLEDKFRSFGWNIAPRPYNGHSGSDILESFKWLDESDDWPKVVLYDTIKGAFVSFSEGSNAWHGAKIDDEHYKIGEEELLRHIEEREAAL